MDDDNDDARKGERGATMTKTANEILNRRDFDLCGKKRCGALRYYHDQTAKHEFVNPEWSGEMAYILFNTDRADNEARITAVTSNKELAERWAAHSGNHYDEFRLDYVDEVRWALKADEGQP